MEAELRQAIGIVEDEPFVFSSFELCAAAALWRASTTAEERAERPVYAPSGVYEELLAFVCEANGFVGASDPLSALHEGLQDLMFSYGYSARDAALVAFRVALGALDARVPQLVTWG